MPVRERAQRNSADERAPGEAAGDAPCTPLARCPYLRSRVPPRGAGTTPNRSGPMGIIGTIIIGLIAGAIAKLLMPGKDPGGFIITILLGIAGAFLGTFLGRNMGLYGPGEGAGLIASIIGAVIILAIYRMFAGRRRTGGV